MKTLFTILIVACNTFIAVAQEPDIKTMIGFACFYGGTATAPVKRAERLLSIKHYQSFSRMLTAPEAYNRFLAVIILERLDKLGQRDLSEKERKQILAIKESEDKVVICQGCAGTEELTLKTLFYKHANGTFSSFHWLEQRIK